MVAPFGRKEVFAKMIMKIGREEIFYNTAPLEQRAAATRAALEAGRHVYSDDPLAASPLEAHELTELAKNRGFVLCCGVAGE